MSGTDTTIGDSQAIAAIRKRDADGTYPDVWHCPVCTFGEMGIESDACEPRDTVVCGDCGHECMLQDILFIRGDIADLLEALDDARRGLRELTAWVELVRVWLGHQSDHGDSLYTGEAHDMLLEVGRGNPPWAEEYGPPFIDAQTWHQALRDDAADPLNGKTEKP